MLSGTIGDMNKRIEFTVPEDVWDQIEKHRGDVPRAKWMKRAVGLRLTLHGLADPTRVALGEAVDEVEAPIGFVPGLEARPSARREKS